MIRTRGIFPYVVAFVVIAIVTEFLIIRSVVTEPRDKFILAHGMPATHIFEPASQIFMASLKALDGPQAEYHPSGTLGDWVLIFEQVALGAIPMSLTFSASDIDPRLNLAYLAYIVVDWESAYQLFGPEGMLIDIYDGILADNGVVMLGIIPSGFASIATRKGVNSVPVNFPSDGKGLKIRVPNVPIAVQRFETWGFSPLPISYSELHIALQLGSVDARSFAPPAEILQMKDVIGSYILTRDYFEFAFWTANRKWWDGLDEQDRQRIQTAVNDSVAWSWENAKKIELRQLQEIKAAGITVVELTDDQLDTAKSLLMESEWNWVEKKVGSDLLNSVRAAIKRID
ncbi:MAG: TRAP transporter substrate-binding protein DctP [Gammaproteobacteria bacterium]|nr:TRAP transporter substrate-binding protein DctP [Gammaproteobacteria bacterium]